MRTSQQDQWTPRRLYHISQTDKNSKVIVLYTKELTDFFFQTTFHYTSKLWSNTVNFNLPGGKTGLDTHETKLPTYWNTPFNKICLGMKIGQQFKSVVINHQSRSLYSLIADGKYRATSLGRNTWKKLIGSRASLQPNCNKEGFNVLYNIARKFA